MVYKVNVSICILLKMDIDDGLIGLVYNKKFSLGVLVLYSFKVCQTFLKWIQILEILKILILFKNKLKL